MPYKETDLSFVSDADLLSELSKHYPDCIFCAASDRPDETPRGPDISGHFIRLFLGNGSIYVKHTLAYSVYRTLNTMIRIRSNQLAIKLMQHATQPFHGNEPDSDTGDHDDDDGDDG